MTAKTLLHATEIEHTYGRIPVLEGVSISLEAGTVTALIGPNGAGKTTLIRALAGLTDPTGGTVEYTGPETTRRVGYLPQRPAFRPGQTAFDAVSFYTSLVGGGRDDAEATLERVGLGDAADRPVEALSGGMTRLLGIAQATVGEPPVVILDEPASGLDPEMSLHVFDTLAALAEDGAAVLLSSHDLALVEETADTVGLLDGGEFVARGSPDALRERTGTDSLLGAFKSSVAGESGTVSVRREGDR